MLSFLTALEKIFKALATFGMGLMLVIVFAQVITRYVFSYTPSFGEELARYLFVWVVFISLPLVAKAGGHMAIETLTVRLKGMKLKICRVLADIFTMIFLLIMVVQGVRMVLLADFQTSAALEIPMSWVYVVMPVGCAVMFISVSAGFIQLLRTPPDDVK
jgi:TRAP-type C4-dicarboxylate transport system permease small subunit